MKFKYLLETLNDDGDVELTKEYRTLKEIAYDIQIEYFQVRELLKVSQNPKKYYHYHTSLYINTYRIRRI